MKVLVTGGCGMIGYHTAMYYHNQGHEVDVMDNYERSELLGHEVSSRRKYFNSSLLKQVGINVFPNDVSVQESWLLHTGHNLIVHLAAQCGVPTSIENPRRDFEVNVVGTFNALEYARKHNSIFVFASTNKVYPIHDQFMKLGKKWGFDNPTWNLNGFPELDELTGSRTPYGWSKYAADLLCQEYHHTYGLKTGVFRMSCIYGPNQFGFEEQGWATWFVIATHNKKEITIFGDGCQVRDMLYVGDCVKAYDAFVTSKIEHGVYNLGGGVDNTLSLNECLEILDSEKKTWIRHDDWRPSDQKCYVSNISKLEYYLGWKPKTSPESGLAIVREWVEKNEAVFD